MTRVLIYDPQYDAWVRGYGGSVAYIYDRLKATEFASVDEAKQFIVDRIDIFAEMTVRLQLHIESMEEINLTEVLWRPGCTEHPDCDGNPLTCIVRESEAMGLYDDEALDS